MDYEKKLLQPYEVSRAAYKCGTIERKMLYYAALLVQHRPYKKGVEYSGYVAEFSIYDFCQLLGCRTSGRDYIQIKKAVKTICTNTITLYEDEEELQVLAWLQEGVYSQAQNKIILVFTDKIGRLFCECKERFSLINPHVIGSLQSFYSMRYYEIALSYSGLVPWEFTLTIDQIRAMFKIDSYEGRLNNFILKVIKEPIEELNANNPDFKITVEKIPDESDKRKISAIKFNCKSYSKKQKIQKNDSPASKRTKRELNEIAEERAPIERARALYPEEFARRVEVAKARTPVAFGAVAEQAAYESMKADGYDI